MTHTQLLQRLKAQFEPTRKEYKRRSKRAVKRLVRTEMLKVWTNVDFQLLEDVKRVKLNSLER